MPPAEVKQPGAESVGDEQRTAADLDAIVRSPEVEAEIDRVAGDHE